MAAPGLRMTSPPRTPAKSQTAASEACMPGSAALSGELTVSQASPHAQKMTPAATPKTLATTMSTTRHWPIRARGVARDVVAESCCVVDDACTDRALSVDNRARVMRYFASLRWHYPDQVRRSKLEKLPLSPAHRTPVFLPIIAPLGLARPRRGEVMAVLLLVLCALFMLLIARFIHRRRRILAGLPVHGPLRIPAWVRRRFTRTRKRPRRGDGRPAANG